MKKYLIVAARIALATPADAADIVADSVSQNLVPPLHNGGSACPANVAVLSDGDFSRPGYCPLAPPPAGYTVTFDFSPAADARTTGLRIWSNAGGNYADAELRVFDVEVDYVDDGGSPQTLVLTDVDIGDTVSVPDDKFVAFTSVDPAGLRGATQIRLSNLRGRSGDARIEFREVNAVVVTPPTVILSSAPAAPGAPFTVTATFSEDVTGVDLADFAVTGATPSTLVQVSPSVYQFTVTPAPTATGVDISLPAGTVTDVDEGALNVASGTLNVIVSAALPPTDEEVLVDTIRSEELKTLRQSIARAQDMSRGARDRLGLTLRCRTLETDPEATPEELEECDHFRNAMNRPLTLSGSAETTVGRARIEGNFQQQSSNLDGTKRRLFFGAFDVTDDSDLGLIATLSARVAWERLHGDHTLWGYFVGAEASLSDVPGTYSGDRQRLGVSGGVYGARDLQNGLVADGFAVLGYGLNTLDLSDGAVDIDADYAAPTVLLGAALSGERVYDRFTLHPELALAVGYTDIGNIDYDAGAGSAEADGDYVALARLSLTPEMRMPWDIGGDTYDQGSFDVAPRLICEWVEAGNSDSDCGVGLELELSAFSNSGLHELSGRVAVESIGGSERTSLGLYLDSRF